MPGPNRRRPDVVVVAVRARMDRAGLPEMASEVSLPPKTQRKVADMPPVLI